MTIKKTPKAKKTMKPTTVVVPKQAVTVAPLHPPAGVPGRPSGNITLRIEAQAVYLQDMHGCTVDDVHRDARFKHISISTFRQWSNQDDWIGKRKVAYKNLEKRLTEETQARLTEYLYHEIQDLQKMRSKAKELLHGTEASPAVKAQSWEGVAKVLLLTEERIASIAKLAADGIVDDIGKMQRGTGKQLGPGAATPTVPYDSKQLTRIATAIMQEERAILRAGLQAKKDAEKPPEKKEITIDVQAIQQDGPTPGPIDLGDLPIPTLRAPLAGSTGGHSGNVP